MEDQVCPRCRTTKYRNPSLKLLVNVCGHSLCESCVELLFLKGSGSCPDCGIPLRRSNFRVQLFEDPMVEKEVDIRRRVLKDYNKKEEDFQTLEEYNNYLEEIEEIIFNLVNGIDLIETNRRIEHYKKENREVILRNKLRLGRSELELEELLEFEKEMAASRKIETIREEVEAKKKKIRAKEALIDELMFTEGNAQTIVNNFAEEKFNEEKEPPMPISRVTAFSTGIKIGKSHGEFLPKVEEGPLFTYTPLEIVFDGPRPPVWDELLKNNYKIHIRGETVEEKAGGFDTNIACLRAIQEAVAGLYHSSRYS